MEKETEEYYKLNKPSERTNFIPPHAWEHKTFKEMSLRDKLLSENHSIERWLDSLKQKFDDGNITRIEFMDEFMGWQRRQMRLQEILWKRYKVAPHDGFFEPVDYEDEGYGYHYG
jgi:hypothetical protein